MTATETCGICEHDDGNHVLLAIEPMKGGIRRCPVEGCECHATWSPQGVPAPSQEVVEMLTQIWLQNRPTFVETQVAIPGIVPVSDDSWIAGDRC